MLPLLLAATAAGFAASGPAAAQAPFRDLTLHRDATSAQAIQAERQREIDLANRLQAQETRDQGDRAVAAVAQGGARPALPAIDPNAPPALQPSQMAQIPDATLAASNARAIEASKNRR